MKEGERAPPCGSLPCRGAYGVENLRLGRPLLALADRSSLGPSIVIVPFLLVCCSCEYALTRMVARAPVVGNSVAIALVRDNPFDPIYLRFAKAVHFGDFHQPSACKYAVEILRGNLLMAFGEQFSAENTQSRGLAGSLVSLKTGNVSTLHPSFTALAIMLISQHSPTLE